MFFNVAPHPIKASTVIAICVQAGLDEPTIQELATVESLLHYALPGRFLTPDAIDTVVRGIVAACVIFAIPLSTACAEVRDVITRKPLVAEQVPLLVMQFGPTYATLGYTFPNMLEDEEYLRESLSTPLPVPPARRITNGIV